MATTVHINSGQGLVITDNDTTAGVLQDKLVLDSYITKTVLNPSGDEVLQVTNEFLDFGSSSLAGASADADGIAIGAGSTAAADSIQLGSGTNATGSTLQYLGNRLANAQGLYTSFTNPINYSPTDTDNITSHLEAIDNDWPTGGGGGEAYFDASYDNATPNASGSDALAIGEASNATALGSISIGPTNTASGNYSVLLGGFSEAKGLYDVCIGVGSTTNDTGSGSEAVSIGRASDALDEGVAIGRVAQASPFSVAIGPGSSASTFSSNIAIGESSSALGDHSVSVGANTGNSGTDSVALGRNASVQNNFSVQLGAGTLTTASTLQFRSEPIATDNEGIQVKTKSGGTVPTGGNPVAGTMRFDTTSGTLYVYDGTAWVAIN